MSNFDLKSFMINEGLTRVSRDRKRLLNERTEESLSDYTYDVRPGHQWEDVWGRGMTPEDLDIFRNEEVQEDMYLQDGNIESLDEIEPGRYIIISDAEADASEIVPLMGFEDPEDVPWTYYFTIRAHSNPYDNEGILMYRLSGDSKKPLKEAENTGEKAEVIYRGFTIHKSGKVSIDEYPYEEVEESYNYPSEEAWTWYFDNNPWIMKSSELGYETPYMVALPNTFGEWEEENAVAQLDFKGNIYYFYPESEADDLLGTSNYDKGEFSRMNKALAGQGRNLSEDWKGSLSKLVYKGFIIEKGGRVKIQKIISRKAPSQQAWEAFFRKNSYLFGGRSELEYGVPYTVALEGAFDVWEEENAVAQIEGPDGNIYYFYEGVEPSAGSLEKYSKGDLRKYNSMLKMNESDREVATRYRNIAMADPKNADSTKSARNTQHGSTSHHYTGLGSVNQDAEYRKEQAKQNANLKKQLGIKTKPMSREDWITKKLNKELGL